MATRKTVSIGGKNYKEGSKAYNSAVGTPDAPVVRAGSAQSASPKSQYSPSVSYEEASANLDKGGLSGNSLTMAKDALKGAYTLSTPTQIKDPTKDNTSPEDTGSDTGSDYVPRTYLSDSAVQQPKSVDSIERDMRRSAQNEINSLRDYEKTLLDEQAVINDKDARSTQARNVLSGLSGSSEADFAAAETAKAGQKANQAIRSTIEVKVQGILSDIRKDAIAEARAQRGDYAQSIETEGKRRDLATKNIANLAASGVTFDGLRKTSPKEFEYLARQFGSTEALRGAFVLNTPQDQILDKKIVGSTYVISRQNPLTGKVTVETVDIPNLPPDFSATVDLGDRIMFYDPSDPQNKQFFLSKGLSPGSGGGSPTGDQYSNDLDAIVGTVLSTIPTKFGQATFQSQMSRARNDSDKINLVAAQVLKGQPAEVKNDFRNQAVGIAELDKAISLIDSGVKSGALEAGGQYVFNVFGRDFDPKLAQLNAHITSAIQPYRNSVTGAAWGTQEDGEYQQLFGSTKYSPTELRQRLVTVKEMLKNKSAQGLNTFVNPMGYYDNPFASGIYAPSGSKVLVSPDGQEFDASQLTIEEYQQALSDGYTPQ